VAVFTLDPHDERTKVNHFYVQPVDDSIHLIYIYEISESGTYMGYKYHFYGDYTGDERFRCYRLINQTVHDLSRPIYKDVIDINEYATHRQEEIVKRIFMGIKT
jgi:hypothetical protein